MDYNGDVNDMEKLQEFFLGRFMAKVKGGKKVCLHLVESEKVDVRELVFKDVKEMIRQGKWMKYRKVWQRVKRKLKIERECHD